MKEKKKILIIPQGTSLETMEKNIVLTADVFYDQIDRCTHKKKKKGSYCDFKKRDILMANTCKGCPELPEPKVDIRYLLPDGILYTEEEYNKKVTELIEENEKKALSDNGIYT